MSKTRRAIAQELERDEVAESVHSAVEWLKANRTLLVIAVLGIALVVIAISAYNGHRERVARESSAMLSATLDRFGRLMTATDAKQRQDALKDVLTQADNLRAAYPGTPAALEALYIKGRADYTVDKLADARKAYEAYLAEAGTAGEKARGEIAVGYTYENDAFLNGSTQARNTLEQAMNHYTRAVAIAGGDNPHQPKIPYLYDYGLLCQARVYELINQNQKAIALYKQVLKRPEPVAVEKTASANEAGNPLMDMLRQQLAEQENQMSFRATAQLRLDRLQAEVAAPAPKTTTATAVAPAAKAPLAQPAPAKAATPAASPAAPAQAAAPVKAAVPASAPATTTGPAAH